MSATVAAALKKIAIYILGDEKKRGKLFVLIGSIAVGFIGLMCLPVAVLSSMGSMEIEQPQIDKSLFNESAIMAGLSSEQQAKIAEIQNSGQLIEDAMSNAGVREQTIKAQLIYMSYFDDVQNFNAGSYANLFAVAPNDSDLIAAINSTYGLEINYDEYMRTYTWVMNSTINGYMFSDESTKNCADLAAWAENAYISGWGYMNGFIGERNESDRIRYADNAGLMLGYLNYDPTEKVFSSDYDTLVYTEQGGLDTMPEVAGIGLFDGSQHGIYVGDGEVIFASRDCGYVNKNFVSNGSWTSWCTYEGVNYPKEVQDTVESLHSGSDTGSNDNTEPVPDETGNLTLSTISVSCIKAEWKAETNFEYEVFCDPIDPNTGYTENIYFEFKSNSLCYITGLRENSAYRIEVKPILAEGETANFDSASAIARTEKVEVIETFPHEDGRTNCFAYENAAGLTRDPSWGAIQNCSVDVVTNTGIMCDEYGDYCVAMGTVYGYCNDRFLVELQNGTQFTVKICDSKGDIPYHEFGNGGKCVIEFIHADGCLPSSVAFTGNYGSFNWSGLNFDNIRSIKKINYGEKIEY